MPQSLVPGRAVPHLVVATLEGTDFSARNSKPEFLTLIEIYRGLHCPRCHRHLLALSSLLPRFAERGVDVIAISTDPEDRARKAHGDWKLGDLQIGFGLEEKTARDWGIYLSEPITEREPKPFSEPATFWVQRNGRLYAATYGTTPFSRPHWTDWLEALDVIRAKSYPPRGDLG